MRRATFAERLKEAMEVRNMSAAELSRQLEISEGVISQYKSGKYEPKYDRVVQFSKFLKVNEAWLMGYDIPMDKNSLMYDDAWAGMNYYEQYNTPEGMKRLEEEYEEEKKLANESDEQSLLNGPYVKEIIEKLNQLNAENLSLAKDQLDLILNHQEKSKK